MSADQLKPDIVLSEEMRVKWAQRLSIRVDRSDSGTCLPLTAQALAADDRLECLEGLSHALLTERVIVPVNVERHPDEDGEHHHIAPESDEAPHFVQVVVGNRPAIVCYSSVEALHADRPDARPMPLQFRKVALTALAQTHGRILFDPAGSAVMMPRPMVAALAQGDSWLPAWKDAELYEELVACVSDEGDSRIVSLRLEPDAEGVVIRIVLGVSLAFLGEDERGWLMEVIQRVRGVKRLGPACDTVEIVPIPVKGEVKGTD